VAFVRDGADRYGERRDMVADDATLHLSAYLRLGMCISAQVGRALGLPGPLSAGREAFWRQIAWREFFHHHLARYPEVARAALREDLRGVAWDDDPAGVRAWAAGETGFPLIDAGMRQLAETGWMHNRARIVTASFLVKDLLVDWRVGETHFMRQLVDGDPAGNNGAGSGRREPAPTRRRTSACSTRCGRPSASTRRAPTCGAGCPSCATSRTRASTSPGR
jgi:deoxyribodipyrimidine photo-lyase